MKLRVRRTLLWVCGALVLAYTGMLYNTVRLDASWAQDYTAFYTGWTVARSADRENLYDFRTQKLYQTQILARDGHDAARLQDGLLPYLNPPHVTALFVPLTLVSRRTSFIVWTVLQLGITFLLGRAMQNNAAFLVFAATPLVIMILGVGALSLLVTLAIWKAYEALKDGSDTRAALWLALATVKPQMCLLLIIGFVVARPRLIWKLAVALSIPTVGSLLLTGVKPFLAYPSLLQSISSMPGRYSLLISTNTTLRGFLFLVFGYEQVSAVNVISSAGLLGACGAAVYLWRWSGLTIDLKIATTAWLGLLFGPHLNPIDDVLLVIPSLLLYRCSKTLSLFLLGFPLILLAEWKFVLGFRPCSPSIYVLALMLAAVLFKKVRGEISCAPKLRESSPEFSLQS